VSIDRHSWLVDFGLAVMKPYAKETRAIDAQAGQIIATGWSNSHYRDISRYGQLEDRVVKDHTGEP